MNDLGCAEQKHASQPVARAIHFSKPAAMGVDGATNDRVLSDGGLDKGSFLSQSGTRYSERLLNGAACTHEVDSQHVHVSRRIDVLSDGAESLKADVLQELLQLAEEYESEEAAKRRLTRKECHVCGTAVLEDEAKEHGAPDTINSSVKEDNCHKIPGQSSKGSSSKWPDLKKLVPLTSKGQVPTSSLASSLSISKAAVKASTKVQTEGNVHKKDATNDDENNESVNITGMDAVSQRSITNCTVPRPFTLATDKRAGNGGRVADGESGGQTQKAVPLNGASGNSVLKNSQVSKKMGSKADGARFAHSESIQHQEQAKDDMAPVSSLQSGSKAPKTKASNVTSASGFNFKCQERAEKRREFYARLEERMNAKEDEKNRMQEKSKEQNEEQLRLLRKSLMYKAHPMPSFYTEGPPAKAELKKMPLTRARSPKFTRRNSHPGCEKGCSRYCKFTHFDDQYRPRSSEKPAERNTDKLSGKHINGCTKKLEKSLSKKLPNELSKVPRANSCPTSDVSSIDVEVVAVNGSVNKLDVKMSPTASLFSEHEVDEEKYGGHGAWDDKFSNPAAIEHLCLENSKFDDLMQTPVFEVTERLCEMSKANGANYLQIGPEVVTGLPFANSDELKPALDNIYDLAVKANKTANREQLKELTPFFQKQESSQNIKESAGVLDMDTMMAGATKGL